jgi:hypothetical protein
MGNEAQGVGEGNTGAMFIGHTVYEFRPLTQMHTTHTQMHRHTEILTHTGSLYRDPYMCAHTQADSQAQTHKWLCPAHVKGSAKALEASTW